MWLLRKATRAATGFVLIAGALLTIATPARAQAVDRVVATVDGEPITTHDIKTFTAANRVKLPGPGDPDYSKAMKAVLKGLIEQKMLEQESKKYGDKVQDSQVDAYVQSVEQQNHLSNQQFRDQLTANGLSYEEFRHHARLDIERMMMLQDEVRNKISIPESEIRAYYKAHSDEFQVEKERFKLAQILIALPTKTTPEQVAAAQAKAERVREQAVKGGDFAELAEKYSDDDSKSKGGELGYFSPSEIMPEIDTAIMKLKPGQISEIVHTEYGFHILKLEEHDQPGTAPLTPEVASQIREKLASEKAKSRFQSWVENDLVKEHSIEAFY